MGSPVSDASTETISAGEQDTLHILADAEADLAAVERLVRRVHPGFEHPTLSKVRALINRLTACQGAQS